MRKNCANFPFEWFNFYSRAAASLMMVWIGIVAVHQTIVSLVTLVHLALLPFIRRLSNWLFWLQLTMHCLVYQDCLGTFVLRDSNIWNYFLILSTFLNFFFEFFEIIFLTSSFFCIVSILKRIFVVFFEIFLRGWSL